MLKRTLALALLLPSLASAQSWRDGQLLVTRTPALHIEICDRLGRTRLDLSAGHQREVDPSWAPDGGIYFVSLDEGWAGGELCWMDSQGGQRRVVVRIPGHTPFLPVASPDGQWVAFNLLDAKQDRPTIWVCRPDGSEAHCITPVGAAFPTWNPNSQEVTCVLGSPDPERRAQLQSYGLDGKLCQVIVSSRQFLQSPSWSPDGRRLLFSRLDGGKSAWLCSVAPDGSDRRTLEQDPQAAQMGGQFDGAGRILYNNLTHAGNEIWVCQSDGSARRRLLKGAYLQGGPAMLWFSQL